MLAFVRERGAVHPREVDEHFAHGSVTNYWGGSSSATTQLLEGMHYRGLLRVARREGGIRLYGVREPAAGPATAAGRRAQVDALVDVVINKYAPLPAASLSGLVGRLRYGVPQWRGELKGALQRARERLAHERVEGVDWYWPARERVAVEDTPKTVRLLAPFDPVVWDRRRFELLWGWAYRFEAYTPPAKRKMGYYALPLLWRDQVIGWANVSATGGELKVDVGYVASGPPRDRDYKPALAAELERMRDVSGSARDGCETIRSIHAVLVRCPCSWPDRRPHRVHSRLVDGPPPHRGALVRPPAGLVQRLHPGRRGAGAAAALLDAVDRDGEKRSSTRARAIT